MTKPGLVIYILFLDHRYIYIYVFLNEKWRIFKVLSDQQCSEQTHEIECFNLIVSKWY